MVFRVVGRALAVLAVVAGAMAGTAEAADQIPPGARPYQRDVIRVGRNLFGLNAPTALFAGQIHQESAWRPEARSRFADGLAQFTPDTAVWIAAAYPALGPAAPFSPAWAIRALITYDRHLYDRTTGKTECDRFAFVLSGYNGGPGWVSRDKRLAALNGADPDVWFGSVEYWSTRAPWAMKENRDYPRRILLRWAPLYSAGGWGPAPDCGGAA